MSSSTIIARPAYANPIDASLPTSGEPVHVSSYFPRKGIACRCLGALLLVAFSPVLLVCMVLVRVTSAGPAFYRQVRLGRNGTPFKIIKLRTMYVDAESLCGPTLCKPGDSRITPIGRILRFFHLDEIPQLINVVRGEMCIVGPRPERPEIIERNRLRQVVPGFDERMRVLPGITGLAQINLPADETALSVIPKVQLDLEYIKTATVGLDLRILGCTAMRMVGIRYGIAVRLFRLGRKFDSSTPHSERPSGPQRGAHQHLVDTVVGSVGDDDTLHGEQPVPNRRASNASVKPDGDGVVLRTDQESMDLNGHTLSPRAPQTGKYSGPPRKPR